MRKMLSMCGWSPELVHAPRSPRRGAKCDEALPVVLRLEREESEPCFATRRDLDHLYTTGIGPDQPDGSSARTVDLAATSMNVTPPS